MDLEIATLILKCSRLLAPPGAGLKVPEMTDKQIEDAVRGMGLKITEENKKNVREKMAQSMKLVKSMKIRGTSTELYRNISSPSLKKEDFVFVPPKDAVLKESLFGGFSSGKVPRPLAGKPQWQYNLRELALAMHNYAQANRRFPPAVLYGPDGKTPYSWRVALLPFLNQKALYDQYHFDEPWDGPNNRKLFEKMPAVFHAPSPPPDANAKNASYFALVGPGTMFDGKKGTEFREITDGTSNTILLVEAKRDIPWTKPEDIPYDPDKRLPELGGYFENGFCVAMTDGSTRMLPNGISDKTLRALITKAGGEAVSIEDALHPEGKPPVVKQPAPSQSQLKVWPADAEEHLPTLQSARDKSSLQGASTMPRRLWTASNGDT